MRALPLTKTLSTGANCIRCCWRKTKATGLSIICASRTTTALREAQMRGFVHVQVALNPGPKT